MNGACGTYRRGDKVGFKVLWPISSNIYDILFSFFLGWGGGVGSYAA